MLKPTLLLGLALFQSVVHAYDVSPGEWRKANINDYQTLDELRKSPYFVEGDFDGDGKNDQAWVMIRKDRPGWGVFLYLAKDKKPLNLMEYRGSNQGLQDAKVMTRAPRGTYSTACGSSRRIACLPNEPDAVTIATTGFILSQADGSSLVFWDPNLKSFNKVDTTYRF